MIDEQVPNDPDNNKRKEAKKRIINRAKKRKLMSELHQEQPIDEDVPESVKETEGQKLLTWRTDRFEQEFGIPRPLARRLAATGLDVHELAKFMKDHPACTLETAIDILE